MERRHRNGYQGMNNMSERRPHRTRMGKRKGCEYTKKRWENPEKVVRPYLFSRCWTSLPIEFWAPKIANYFRFAITGTLVDILRFTVAHLMKRWVNSK
jgi:hypothetical protein